MPANAPLVTPAWNEPDANVAAVTAPAWMSQQRPSVLSQLMP
jgi:hypothetical protein